MQATKYALCNFGDSGEQLKALRFMLKTGTIQSLNFLLIIIIIIIIYLEW